MTIPSALAVRVVDGLQRPTRELGADVERESDNLQDTVTHGVVSAVRGPLVDIETMDARGRTRTLRGFSPQLGSRRLSVGDRVAAWTESNGSRIAAAMPAGGGRSDAFWARVLDVYPHQSDASRVAQMAVMPIKGRREQLFAYAMPQTESVRRGQVVLVSRDDGGETTDAAFSYAPLYFATAVRFPIDTYGRTRGRPTISYAEYAQREVGRQAPAESIRSVVRLRSANIQYQYGSGRRSRRTTTLSVDDFAPQEFYWGVGTADGSISDNGRIYVVKEYPNDEVNVSGGVSAVVNDGDSNQDVTVSTGGIDFMTKADNWDVGFARSISEFFIDVVRGSYEPTRYVVVVYRDNPYGASPWPPTS